MCHRPHLTLYLTYPVRSGAGVGGSRTRTVFFQPQPCQGWECPTAPGNGLPPGATDVGCSATGGAGCSWFGLQVIAVKTSYGSVRGATAATEWSLTVRSTAPVAESLPLCAVRTLNATLALPAASNLTIDFRDACAIVSPSHPAPPGSGRQPGDGPAPNPICANGPVQPPARLLTARPLECSGAGGCQPNQFHPQLASFPPGDPQSRTPVRSSAPPPRSASGRPGVRRVRVRPRSAWRSEAPVARRRRSAGPVARPRRPSRVHAASRNTKNATTRSPLLL